MVPRLPRPSDLAGHATRALLLTAAADFLIFRRSLGLGLTVLAILVASAAILRYRGRLKEAVRWSPLWLVLAAVPAIQSSSLGALLLLGMTWAMLTMATLPARTSLFRAFVFGFVGGTRSLLAAPRDSRLSWFARIRRAAAPARPAWIYGFPAVVVLLFAALIIPANVILSQWTTAGLEWLRDQVATLDAARLVFWVFSGLTAYGLFRFRLGQWTAMALAGLPADMPDGEEHQRHELRACLLTLLGLNALFLAANGTDLAFLWLGFKLPAGITYSQFAHQGSYRLIAAVVLAAIAISAFFRRLTLQSRHGGARALAFLFILQNLAVLAGATRRLHIYVEVYGLSRFRVATFLWMLLVAVGFVLIFVKVRGGRPFRFLVEANAITTALLLTAVAVLNLDGFIAGWNVRRYEKGERLAVDVDYLRSLGAGAMPPLARLARIAEPVTAKRALAAVNGLLAGEKAAHADWRDWTWRREQSIRQAEAILGGR